ncbi:WD repeat protein [Rhizophagus clarus]|uniref:WD repeat protein n=1 Tax=Rhizophagus clarus TaxID=94130 RepID=A0A8H3KVA4_9GLOM|nr:WD repeat protein [Rhizophagus clarus]
MNLNDNNDSEISDNFSDFPVEQVATPVPESPEGITESQDSNYIPITENEDNSDDSNELINDIWLMGNNSINPILGIYRLLHRSLEIHEESDNENSSNSSLNDNNEVDADGMNKGEILMKSGEFGIIEPSPDKGLNAEKLFSKNACHQLMLREILPGRFSKVSFGKNFIPNTNGEVAVNYGARAYSGQYSLDGSFFYTCCQDFRVHIYDTTNPNVFKETKTITGDGRWTITDANLSSDNQWLAYTSITPIVYLAKTDPNVDFQIPLDFSERLSYNNGLWSIRFSNDSRELVGGASDSNIYVYDIETRNVLLQLNGHDDDVNAVCFADDSSHILFSGSDDTYIKVWDRRSMRGGKESGVLVGHTEGITYVTAKGDGRYCLSNSKDQTMKLWDIRMMISGERFENMQLDDYRQEWDYRSHNYPGDRHFKHPQDVSVMTYRGHSVLKTLIRCHFSPPSTTGQRYLYTGSEDGRVRIFSLDGRVVQSLDVIEAIRNERNRNTSQLIYLHRPVTRDVSWHPHLPLMTSTSWSGPHVSSGVIVCHSYKEPDH